jgi:hypothetical protein
MSFSTFEVLAICLVMVSVVFQLIIVHESQRAGSNLPALYRIKVIVDWIGYTGLVIGISQTSYAYVTGELHHLYRPGVWMILLFLFRQVICIETKKKMPGYLY